MNASCNIPVAMTIAGSDSGGGAGLQADLKVFAALKVFGTTAITCITAQNPATVAGVEPVSPDMVSLQIQTVFSAFEVKAVKTGMLYSPAIIRAVAREVQKKKSGILVVDPVMIATSGNRLIQSRALTILCSELLPLATVITPNIPEAEWLSGRNITNLAEAQAVAVELACKFNTACVVKGGHLRAGTVTDILCVRGKIFEFQTRRIAVDSTHGTGCRFSAALTACLAKGLSLPRAVNQAQKFVAGSLKNPMYG